MPTTLSSANQRTSTHSQAAPSSLSASSTLLLLFFLALLLLFSLLLSFRMELISSQIRMGKVCNSSCWFLSLCNPAKTDVGEFELLEQQTYLKLGLIFPKLTKADYSTRKDKKNEMGSFDHG